VEIKIKVTLPLSQKRSIQERGWIGYAVQVLTLNFGHVSFESRPGMRFVAIMGQYRGRALGSIELTLRDLCEVMASELGPDREALLVQLIAGHDYTKGIYE
jgi:hypothetical protein